MTYVWIRIKKAAATEIEQFKYAFCYLYTNIPKNLEMLAYQSTRLCFCFQTFCAAEIFDVHSLMRIIMGNRLSTYLINNFL